MIGDALVDAEAGGHGSSPGDQTGRRMSYEDADDQAGGDGEGQMSAVGTECAVELKV